MRSYRLGFRSSARAWLPIGLAAAAIAVVGAASPAFGAGQDSQPIASAGPLTTADGATASGRVGSGGQTDACLNDRHSGADPSSTQTSDAVRVNDLSCQTSSSSTGGGQAGGGRTAGQRSGTASVSGSSNGQSSRRRVALTVAASNATGLRIASVRYRTAGAQMIKRVTVLVTVRDARGRLVRDAIVSLGALPGAKLTVSCKCAGFSNRRGQASLVLPVKREMFGKRLLFRIVARTPSAHAGTLGPLLLPAASA
jgi:hypothetical protein